MILPIIFLYNATILNLKRIVQIASLSIPLSIALSASKLYAVYALMRHFPREIFDSYNCGVLQGLAGMAAQLLGAMVLAPMIMLGHHDLGLLAGAFSNITCSQYGIWEIETGLSPVLIIFLFIGLARAGRTLRTSPKLTFTRSQVLSILVLILVMWITIEMTLTKGILYTLTKQLPILKSLHVNVRFTAAFILPLVIVGAFQLHRYFSKSQKPLYFWAGVLLTNIC